MSDTEPVDVLQDEECWELLGGQELGRLVTHVGRVIDIFPVNFVVDEQTVVFRTAEGSKLFELTVNDEVVFEVDDHEDEYAWSVIVRGHAHRLDTAAEVAAADELPLKPWIPTLKYVYVRIIPDALTGRRFHRGPEPDRYGIQQY
ncbi:pyridoxamine 5'-phosphate oxidase family protein [Microbacterium sp. BWT-B31]|uniref:pyridoxamine 5'-phosphate oxidase family protein n=1 Tax=Microbacterium sp. BWT-B31 TaxID=3232072 RepID=UPI003527694E